ncbi:hypothetical protein CCP2SC5_30038 [Azospirillaceae bacterium]
MEIGNMRNDSHNNAPLTNNASHSGQALKATRSDPSGAITFNALGRILYNKGGVNRKTSPSNATFTRRCDEHSTAAAPVA